MIQANCLVFPKPRQFDVKIIQKHLVYIPKDRNNHHFYSSQKAVDDLTCTSSPRYRQKGQSNSNMFKFKIMMSIKTKRKCTNGYIPCVYLKGTYYENKLIIYFHSNGQDLISAFRFVEGINTNSGRSVLMMEYPGYSIYKKVSHTKLINQQKYGSYYQTTSEDIEQDAKRVLQYMKDVVGYSLKDISIMGRSIGSGPAVYIASIYPVGSLILLSPFLSLKQAVKDMYGALCSNLIKQRFNNKERVKLVQCPSLLIHGLQDSIIPYSHSIKLNQLFNTFSSLKLIERMKHNSFNFHKDFILHVKEFLRNVQIYS